MNNKKRTTLKDDLWNQTRQAMNSGHVSVIVYAKKAVSVGTFKNGVKVA